VRLLLLNHNVAFTGTFFRSHQLAREMTRRGHDVTFVTTSREARLRGRWREIDGVRTLEAPDLLFGPGRTGWDPYNVAHRIGALRGRGFDVIHGFDCRPAVIGPALALRRATGAALVLDWADWWGRGGRIRERSGPVARAVIGPVETWFEEAFRDRADRSTVISRALEERLAGLGVPPETIARVPNGSDTGRITPGDRMAARSALGLRPDTPVVVYVGVLTRGDAALLEAAFRVARERGPGAKLVLVGSKPRPWEMEGIESTGFVSFDRLLTWLAAADLCVIPFEDTVGNRGRWPGKVNDYLSAGRPTLMTRVGDASCYLERAGAGWVTEATGAALGRRMAEVLEDRPGLEEAGRRARVLAETELSWSRMGDRVEAVYQQVRA
jgi:glycosyltransferase involved in cell wall biosynthesis